MTESGPKSYRKILPAILSLFTGPRYFPELEWANNSWTHNIFRVYEMVFGRKVGIRPEITAIHVNGKTTYQAHTLEGACNLIEQSIRGLFNFEIPIRIWIPVLSSNTGLPMPDASYFFAIAINSNASTHGVMLNATDTFNHTCSGSNRELVVAAYESGVAIPNSMTYNSAALTKQVQNTASGTPFVSLWTKSTPSTGTNTVSVSTGGTSSSHSYVYISSSWTGAKTASEIGTTGTTGGTNTTSITVTTTVANSIMIDALVVTNAYTGSPNGTNQTIIGSLVSTSGDTTTVIVAGSSYQTTTTAGSYTTSWTSQSPNTARAVSIELIGVQALIITAALGTFTLTGIAVSLFRALAALVANVGTFALTGIDTTFQKALGIATAVGAFVLTGINTAFPYGRTLTTSTGIFSFVGNAVRLLINGGTNYFTKQTKHSSTFTNQTKHSSTWSNQNKN